MGHLYAEHLGEGRGAAAATHAASLALLQERRAQGLSTHPHFWAPFVASGDWR
jgi:CHAT domain-containing protein